MQEKKQRKRKRLDWVKDKNLERRRATERAAEHRVEKPPRRSLRRTKST